MNSLWKWIKEHVRLYARLKDGDPNDCDTGVEKPTSMDDRIKDVEKRTEVGFKITWKF